MSIPPKSLSHGDGMPPLSSVDHRLEAAAFGVMDGALAIVPGEHVVVVTDASTAEFGEALVAAVSGFRATAEAFVLEDLGPRPHGTLHPLIRRALPRAHASVMHTSFHRGEYPMRAELVDVALSNRLRHAHMVGVTRRSIVAGLAASPLRIAEVSRALRLRILPNCRIHVRSYAGTDLMVHCEPWCRWYETSGVIQPGTKANLPAGELVTSPSSVNGVYVADGWVGDGGGLVHAELAAGPLKITFARGAVVGIEGEDEAMVRQVQQLIARTPNLDRAGLISFGTNVGMTGLVDDIFTNQKLPSFHISLGLSFPEKTGASWTARDWIAFTARNSDVDIDGAAVMRAGRYLIP